MRAVAGTLAAALLLGACSLTYIQVKDRNDNDLTGGQQRGGQLSNDSDQRSTQEQHQEQQPQAGPRPITKCTWK